MTKEKLYLHINEQVGSWDLIEEYLDMFFESNVCIPKGGVLEAKFDGEWVDIFTNDDEYELRIKPSEPVYEWQWKFKYPDSNATWDGYTMYATDEQFETIKMEWMKYQKDEETKRERK